MFRVEERRIVQDLIKRSRKQEYASPLASPNLNLEAKECEVFS